MDTDYPTSYGMVMGRGGQKGPCSSLEQLVTALKEDISAGAESLVPECTTSELSLDLSALLPLQRPNIGPYAERGTHDLPPEFKVAWTNAADPKKSHPQATVGAIMSPVDSRARQIVQRAASRGIVAAIEAIDGFKYSFNNAWGAKDEDGQRFSYICQDSMQNKDRHANGFTRTRKHLKGDGERGPRKPTFDCKGSISVKFSSSRRCVDVYYRHYAIHGTVSDRRGNPLPPRRMSTDVVGGAAQNNDQNGDTGGLLGKLQAEKSAYAPPPSMRTIPPTHRHEASNIGSPLKRKRDSDTPVQSKDTGKTLSLVDLLNQSQSAQSPPVPSPVTLKTPANKRPPPVTYDLPSWLPQKPPPAPANSQKSQKQPVPSNRQEQPPQSGPHLTSPYPPPYQPNQHQHQQPQQFQPTTGRPQFPPPPPTQPAPPRQEVFGAPKHPHPQSQGLFTTLKPVPQDPPVVSTVSYHSNHARRSCFHCRYGKKKVRMRMAVNNCNNRSLLRLSAMSSDPVVHANERVNTIVHMKSRITIRHHLPGLVGSLHLSRTWLPLHRSLR